MCKLIINETTDALDGSKYLIRRKGGERERERERKSKKYFRKGQLRKSLSVFRLSALAQSYKTFRRLVIGARCLNKFYKIGPLF